MKTKQNLLKDAQCQFILTSHSFYCTCYYLLHVTVVYFLISFIQQYCQLLFVQKFASCMELALIYACVNLMSKYKNSRPYLVLYFALLFTLFYGEQRHSPRQFYAYAKRTIMFHYINLKTLTIANCAESMLSSNYQDVPFISQVSLQFKKKKEANCNLTKTPVRN